MEPQETQMLLQPTASYANRKYPGVYEAVSGFDGQNGLPRFWRCIMRRRVAIVLAATAGALFGYVVTLGIQPLYRVQTSLEVVGLNQDFLNMRQASPTTPGDNSFDTSEEATQAKLLTGLTLTQRVIGKLAGDADVSASGAFWPRWLRHPKDTRGLSRRQLLEDAANSVKVKATPHTRVLEITVDSSDPKLARDFANTLTQEFIAEKGEQHWLASQSTREFLRRELDEAKNDLKRSEGRLQKYARTSGIVLTDETTNVATEKLEQVQQILSTASADRIAKQSRYELAQSSPADSLADVLNDDGMREAQSKINDLGREIANFSAVYSAEYSKVRRLKAELASLQAAFNRQRSEILDRIHTDYLDSQRREALLARAYKDQTHEVTDQGEKTVQYKILKREAESNRQIYDTMLQQMKQSSIASALHASSVRVIDLARIPKTPIFPSCRVNSAAGLLLGLLVSAIIVLIRDQVDRTLQEPGEVKMWLDLPELGTIPNVKVAAKYFPTPRYATADLTTRQDRPSMVAEAFRCALTSILYTNENGPRPQVLVFTSANPCDGKTTVVSNLAIASAESRLRVLIIDADMRRPRMHKLFSLSNETGLSDLLRDDLTEAGPDAEVQDSGVMNLHVLTAGRETERATHLLHSPNLPRLLKSVRKEYDMILIDTPPMMQMTDARIVGRQADGVVLVARSGRTSRDSLAAAKGRFQEDHTNILGTMLTDWDPRRAHGGYLAAYYSRPAISYRPDKDAW